MRMHIGVRIDDECSESSSRSGRLPVEDRPTIPSPRLFAIQSVQALIAHAGTPECIGAFVTFPIKLSEKIVHSLERISSECSR